MNRAVRRRSALRPAREDGLVAQRVRSLGQPGEVLQRGGPGRGGSCRSARVTGPPSGR